MLFLPFLKRPVFCGAVLEHFSAVCPASFRRSVRSGSLRGRIHRAARGGTCSARIDPHTVFALAPWAISLKNALVAAPLVFFLRCTCATPTSRRTCAFVGSGGCKQSSNIGVCAFGTTG